MRFFAYERIRRQNDVATQRPVRSCSNYDHTNTTFERAMYVFWLFNCGKLSSEFCLQHPFFPMATSHVCTASKSHSPFFNVTGQVTPTNLGPRPRHETSRNLEKKFNEKIWSWVESSCHGSRARWKTTWRRHDVYYIWACKNDVCGASCANVKLAKHIIDVDS